MVPVAVLDRRVIQRNKTPVGQCLVQWKSLAPDDATWEDATFWNNTFPGHKLFRLEDKALVMAVALSGPEPKQYRRHTPDQVSLQLSNGSRRRRTQDRRPTARIAPRRFTQLLLTVVTVVPFTALSCKEAISVPPVDGGEQDVISPFLSLA